MSMLKKHNKINLVQIKSKQNKITYTSIEKIWDLFSMKLGNRSANRAKRYEVQKDVSIFAKQLISKLIIIRY